MDNLTAHMDDDPAIGTPAPVSRFTATGGDYFDRLGRQYLMAKPDSLNGTAAMLRWGGVAMTVRIPPDVRRARPDVGYPVPNAEPIDLVPTKPGARRLTLLVHEMHYERESSATGLAMGTIYASNA